MKTLTMNLPAVVLLAALLPFGPVGCSDSNDVDEETDKQPQPSPTAATDSDETLQLSIDLPGTTFAPGETFTAEVTATNVSGQTVTIEANTSAKFHLRVWQNKTIGWEVVKKYPEVAAMVITPWKLRSGESVSFRPKVTVEPDWPTYEPLRLSATLNGYDGLEPYLVVEVIPPEGQ
jgi:hypothetical protein